MFSIRSGVGIVCAAGLCAAMGTGFMAGRIAPSGAAVAVAQPEEMSMEEMMRLYEEKNRTGEHHKWMAQLAGEWDAQVKFWDPMSGEAHESKGSEKGELIFDGRYLKANFKGDWMGQPFEGLSLMGYNNAEQRFESIWLDSGGTAIMFSTGQRSGDTLTLTGECKDCMSEQMVQFRHVMKIDSPTKHTFTGYHTMNGQEMKAMEIVYTKRGASMNGRGNDANRPGVNRPGGGNG